MPEIEKAFAETKKAVAQAQMLQVTNPSIPFLLMVSASTDGYGWGLCQKHEAHKIPIGILVSVVEKSKNSLSTVEKPAGSSVCCLTGY